MFVITILFVYLSHLHSPVSYLSQIQSTIHLSILCISLIRHIRFTFTFFSSSFVIILLSSLSPELTCLLPQPNPINHLLIFFASSFSDIFISLSLSFSLFAIIILFYLSYLNSPVSNLNHSQSTTFFVSSQSTLYTPLSLSALFPASPLVPSPYSHLPVTSTQLNQLLSPFLSYIFFPRHTDPHFHFFSLSYLAGVSPSSRLPFPYLPAVTSTNPIHLPPLTSDPLSKRCREGIGRSRGGER